MQKVMQVFNGVGLDDVNWHLRHGWTVTMVVPSGSNASSAYFVVEGDQDPPSMPEKPKFGAGATKAARVGE
jgi:hypothetical protein